MWPFNKKQNKKNNNGFIKLDYTTSVLPLPDIDYPTYDETNK